MSDEIPLTWFLYFAAASFSIGLLGVLVRRNAIADHAGRPGEPSCPLIP